MTTKQGEQSFSNGSHNFFFPLKTEENYASSAGELDRKRAVLSCDILTYFNLQNHVRVAFWSNWA